MNQQDLTEQYPAYYKPIGNIARIDVYGVHDLFEINDPSGALQHASKKILLAGARTGGKPALQDIREARDSLNRYILLQEAKMPQPPVAERPIIVNGPLGFSKVSPSTGEQIALSSPKATTPKAKAIQQFRYVVLYYHNDTSRRFKPMQYFAMADSAKEAEASFYEFYPKAEAVWTEKVAFFTPDAEQVHRRYWAAR